MKLKILSIFFLQKLLLKNCGWGNTSTCKSPTKSTQVKRPTRDIRCGWMDSREYVAELYFLQWKIHQRLRD